MWKNVKNKFVKRYAWLQKNAMNVFIVVVMHLVTSSILSLPYFNLLYIVFGFIAFLIDWILVLILFKPSKENILKFGLSMFVISFPLAVVDAKWPVEMLGNFSYLMIATYILFSLKEIRSK